jgi:hypothetical protein
MEDAVKKWVVTLKRPAWEFAEVITFDKRVDAVLYWLDLQIMNIDAEHEDIEVTLGQQDINEDVTEDAGDGPASASASHVDDASADVGDDAAPT